MTCFLLEGPFLNALKLRGVAGPLPPDANRDTPRTSGHNHTPENFDLMPASPAQHFESPVLDVVGHEAEPSTDDNFLTLLEKSGFSPHKIAELLDELPSSRTANVLVDFYFSTMYVMSHFYSSDTYLIAMNSNWTRYPVSEREFRNSYTSIYTHVENQTNVTEPADVRFLPLLFVVLAISARLVPGGIAGDALDTGSSSLKYYWSCQHSFYLASIFTYDSLARRALLMAAAIQPDSLNIVLTRLLVNIYSAARKL